MVESALTPLQTTTPARISDKIEEKPVLLNMQHLYG